jgi:hypothetical protein
VKGENMSDILPYSIAVEKQEMIVRFHTDMIDQDMLSKFLDYIVFESIRKRKMEQQHAQGYAQHPVEKGEFDIWENEQSWGEV